MYTFDVRSLLAACGVLHTILTLATICVSDRRFGSLHHVAEMMEFLGRSYASSMSWMFSFSVGFHEVGTNRAMMV